LRDGDGVEVRVWVFAIPMRRRYEGVAAGKENREVKLNEFGVI
jgi:hypothetical protein